MGSLSPDERKEKGKAIKALFDSVEKAFHERQDSIQQAVRNEQLNKDLVDRSLPPQQLDEGHMSLLTQTRRRVEEIFQGM
jgi:phenylalanyl-tRNA synthetase alpha chain